MTEQEVLTKLDQFKNAIVSLKEKVSTLEKENTALKSESGAFNNSVEAKVQELESLLNEN